MSDILIKGIELPKGDRIFRTVKIFKDGTVVQEGEIIGKVVDVKPHGDLIDRGELMEKVREEADFPSHEWCKAIECLEDAPTVLEAST